MKINNKFNLEYETITRKCKVCGEKFTAIVVEKYGDVVITDFTRCLLHRHGKDDRRNNLTAYKGHGKI